MHLSCVPCRSQCLGEQATPLVGCALALSGAHGGLSESIGKAQQPRDLEISIAGRAPGEAITKWKNVLEWPLEANSGAPDGDQGHGPEFFYTHGTFFQLPNKRSAVLLEFGVVSLVSKSALPKQSVVTPL